MDQILNSVGPFLSLVDEAWAGIRGLDRQTQLLIAAGLGLLLLFLVVRSRLARSAGQRDLRKEHRKLAKSGIEEWQLPYRLLAGREGWDVLPEEFLMELAARLGDLDTIIEFVLMVEDENFDRDFFVRLTNYEAETAMSELSVMLTDYATELKARKAGPVLAMAARVDPENPLALIDLATQHYTAKRYKQALPLLEQAMDLNRQGIMPPTRVGGKQAISGQTLHELLKIVGEMYEDCAKRVKPKAA